MNIVPERKKQYFGLIISRGSPRILYISVLSEHFRVTMSRYLAIFFRVITTCRETERTIGPNVASAGHRTNETVIERSYSQLM